MAAEGEEQRMSLDLEEERDDSSSGTENGDSADEEEAAKVEWLATGREKRSTAGNRMKSMLAAEEPDDELELLFAEDGDDAGFTDVDDEGSDVHMDSSSDDEDAQDNADEDEGERELEKQARENRQATRKRKAQEAIPMKFRKKVRLNTTVVEPSTAAPAPTPAPESAPRLKKKSERMSWLPSPADAPTRASRRETTMLSKEQLHQQMVEREVKRLKQVEAMERKAKKMEALKKPPMTQAERLAEAAIVEKRNAKSLNRWEEAEKQREEERRARLAALNSRTLSGPVVTIWSGMGEWIDGKLKHVGKMITIEERPVKKRVSVAETSKAVETPSAANDIKEEQTEDIGAPAASSSKPAERDRPAQTPETTEEPTSGNAQAADTSTKTPDPVHEETENPPTVQNAPQPEILSQQLKVPEPQAVEMSSAEAESAGRTASESKPPEVEMKPPDLTPPSVSPYTTSMFAPPPQSQLMKPPELKPPSQSFLAPPAGATHSGLSMPMLGYSSTMHKASNVLAPPNTVHRQSPLSMPQSISHPPSAPVSTPAPTPPPRLVQTPPAASIYRPPPKTASKPLSSLKPSQTNASKKQQVIIPDLPLSPPRPPPPNGKATRNCIILQNFDENAIGDKAVQQHILFGKEMRKLGKQAPAPKCIITNKLARYKDPKTGLPYYDARAFKEIQKLQRGDYKWSRLVGAWVGTGSFAAQGVPARFLDPNAPPPPKPTEVKYESVGSGKQGDPPASKTATPATSVRAPGQLIQPVSAVSHGSPVAAASKMTTATSAPTATTPICATPVTPAPAISVPPSTSPAPSAVPLATTAPVLK
ncbi:YL1 nuclear protein-domain-containing protein [Xylariales sp. AK1849]|nr:YL1 nuclear protein-domain-containing protein [Xylariales sp. AK1849]